MTHSFPTRRSSELVKHEPPVVLADGIGAVSERQRLRAAVADAGALDRPVGEVMGPALPTVGIGEPLSEAMTTLDGAAAALVLDGGHPVGVVTRSDVLGSLLGRSEEHTSELQSLMRISYAVFCLKKKT